eukprot:gene21530-28520_t
MKHDTRDYKRQIKRNGDQKLVVRVDFARTKPNSKREEGIVTSGGLVNGCTASCTTHVCGKADFGAELRLPPGHAGASYRKQEEMGTAFE